MGSDVHRRCDEALVTLNKCHIETVESGYGAYADGNSMIHSSGSTFDVTTYGLILSGGSGIFTDGSVVNSRRIGVMAHGGSHGTLTIDKGSVSNTDEAVIQLKSSSPDILIDDARLNSKEGIILEMFPNDDPNRGGPGAGGPPPGGGAAGGPGAGGPPGGGFPVTSGKYNTTNGTDDEDTTIKNSKLKGDFINALTKRSSMNISLVNSTVDGAITTAASVHKTGPHGEKLVMQDSNELYYLIGEVDLTYAATDDAHGATVSLDGDSGGRREDLVPDRVDAGSWRHADCSRRQEADDEGGWHGETDRPRLVQRQDRARRRSEIVRAPGRRCGEGIHRR